MPELEVIEGEASEVIVRPPQERGLARADSPTAMIGLATELADALKHIVEKQKLYSVINGKKFPQVEAWMTIGRMDNVVAREAERPIRNEDGSYEAFVELVRLSDGMVVGRASAMCGSPDDPPWFKRSEPNRRSMAVTRATSRAFRQQYSWIMALAGYQPTPAEEMVHEEPPPPAQVESETLLGELTRTGKIAKGDGAGSDLQYRQGPDGHSLHFRLEIPGKNDDGSPKNIPQVWAEADLGETMYAAGIDPEKLKGEKATCTGKVYAVAFPGRRTFHRMKLTRIVVGEVIIPPAEVTPIRSPEAQASLHPAQVAYEAELPVEEAAQLEALADELPWPAGMEAKP